MGECARECKRIAVMEASSTSSSKKRKIIGSQQQLQMPSEVSADQAVGDHCAFLNNSSQKPVVTRATSSNSGVVVAGDLSSSFCSDPHCTVSRCSSNDSCEVMKERFRFVDLEAKNSETGISTYMNNNFSRETTPSSELCGDSEEMESTQAKPPPKAASRGRRQPGKEPPEAEIEEFFAEVEKYERKRFAEKYNYDILKDVPLEGRFQWFRLNHEREVKR